ncbi:hypothetical protein [Streptomyces sp. SYSU K217416]
MKYLVAFDSEVWRLARHLLAAAIGRDWPDAEVRVSEPVDSEVRDVEWHLVVGGREIEGYSNVNGQCINLAGPLDLAAAFVAWYRKLVPESEEVIFCDDAYSFAGEVRPGTIEQEVVAMAEAAC